MSMSLDVILPKPIQVLLNPAGDLRKDIPCIRANHPYNAHDNDENNGQYNGVLSNILAFRVAELE